MAFEEGGRRIKIAVVIPCYNEEKTVAKVVGDFRRELPGASVLVMDNNSTDDSFRVAGEAGAQVLEVRVQGKGAVIQQMCDDVDADVFVIVDGDDTYEARDVNRLMQPVLEGRADMVIGRRKITGVSSRLMNRVGNKFFSWLLSFWSGIRLHDVLSGYRVVNSRFVRKVPILCREFEVEAEMTFQAIAKGMRILEVDTDYRPRPGGSVSKLSIWKDGYAILSAIVSLTRDLRPLTFFSIIAVLLWMSTFIFGIFIFYNDRLANLFDVVILISLFVIGWMFMLIGFSLHTINRRFEEIANLLGKKKNV